MTRLPRDNAKNVGAGKITPALTRSASFRISDPQRWDSRDVRGGKAAGWECRSCAASFAPLATDSLADHCAAAAHTTGVTCLLCAEDVDCGAPLAADQETVQVETLVIILKNIRAVVSNTYF